jgi:hypothetical protein
MKTHSLVPSTNGERLLGSQPQDYWVVGREHQSRLHFSGGVRPIPLKN